ncbi:NACHT domain-containing protein [Streptosporangium sp. NPDC002524]|uniref:NACHT N-terminal Helical domain 1-containing protein n=1 Tax=Streptosporangium sp. NPDC002524 TaxID=3154537 RepID=UPI00331C5EE3
MAVNDRSKKLANQIILAVFRVLLPGTATRVQGLSDIANLVFTGQEEKRARAAFERSLRDAKDLLVERLNRFELVEFRRLETAERDLAIEGVCEALESFRIDRDDVIRLRFVHGDIAARLRPAVHKKWRRDLLSEDATEYGEWFLQFACQYIVALTKKLPDFHNELIVDTFVLAQKTYELLEDGIEGVVLPHFRQGTPKETSAFEAHYASDIIHTYKNMELFGLDLPLELQKRPIDIGYIILMAETESAHAAPVDEWIGEIAAHPKTLPRIVISGAAGSGKTTISQWLAVCAAQHSFPRALQNWNGLVPFVVQLRVVFSGAGRIYPKEEALILASSHRGSEVPGDWVSSTLKSGKALIILDGFDELSELHRSDFFIWLEKLLTEYPDVRYVVTSRPEGISLPWFTRQRFSLLRLLPMQLGHIKLCVNAWFDSLVAYESQERRDHYRGRQQALLRDISSRISVREIAETPLLCAMLCAFYADNLSDNAPKSRGELYERVIKALVDKREKGRRSLRGVALEFSERDKLDLLESIACHLTEHSATSILTDDLKTTLGPVPSPAVGGLLPAERPPLLLPAKTVLEIVEECLPGMINITVGAKEAVRILVNRTIVFREVSPGEAQFSHRSFQEYLSALGYAHAGRTDSLVRHITDPGWHRVIAFAAGVFDRPSVNLLINSILDVAEDSYDDQRRSLLLLAAECISVGRRVENASAARAREALTAILPPRSIEEAELIGGGGEGMIRWLSRYTDQPPQTQAACVHAAAVLGGDDGLEVIAQYARTAGEQDVVDEIIRCCERFEVDDYVDRVLSHLPLDDVTVHVTSEKLLARVGRLVGLTRLHVDVGHGPLDFRRWHALTNLTELDCGGHREIASLAGIERLSALRRLNLSGVSGLDELRSLVHLEELYLAGCGKLKDLGHLSELSRLRILILDGCTRIQDFSAIRAMHELRTLSLNGCGLTSLDFCHDLPELRTLRAMSRTGVSDTGELDRCQNLHRLELRLAGKRETPLRLPGSGRLRSLILRGAVTAADLTALASTPNLIELQADDVEGLFSLSCLSELNGLRKLILTDCRTLRDCEGISHLTNLVELDLSGSGIRHLEFVRHMTALTQIRLDGCERLEDISVLREAPNLRHVSLRGSLVAEIDTILDRGQVVVDYDPYYSIITADTNTG